MTITSWLQLDPRRFPELLPVGEWAESVMNGEEQEEEEEEEEEEE